MTAGNRTEEVKEPTSPKNDSDGGLFGCCTGSGVENTVATQPSDDENSPPDTQATSKNLEPTAMNSATTEPAKSSAAYKGATSPKSSADAGPGTSSPPQESAPSASTSDQSNVSEEPKPGLTTAEISETGAPVPEAAVTKASGARPAKNVPAGFVSGTRKDQEISSGVQGRIAGLAASGLQTTNTGGKRMKTPRIITDTKESWDREGNITREITRYITEPDGSKRTEKETVYIPAGEAEA